MFSIRGCERWRRLKECSGTADTLVYFLCWLLMDGVSRRGTHGCSFNKSSSKSETGGALGKMAEGGG